jgi:hypothetical protein
MILEMGLSAVVSGAIASGGESETARFVAEQAHEGRQSLRRTWTFGHAYQETLENLASISGRCSQPDWDGNGAEPVLGLTIIAATRFLDVLPSGHPGPTVSAEPDGHITLEWYRTPWRLLSVSVAPDDSLHYAALLGPNKHYGTEIFFGEIPQSILTLIQQIRV